MDYNYKKCFVPSCQNTTLNSKKIFVSVPKIEDIRKAWSVAVGRKKVPSMSSAGIYCCEDHFNMEQDCENWVGYKLFHTQLKIKKDIIPHRNLSGISDIPRNYSQLSRSAEKRKRSNVEEYAKKQKLHPQRLEFEEESSLTSSEPHVESASQDKPSTSGLYKSFVHKAVQANIKPVKSLLRTIGVNTVKVMSRSVVPFKVTVTKSRCSPSTSSVSTNTESDYNISSTESTDSWQKTAYVSNVKRIDIIIREHSRFYLGLPEDVYFLIKLLENEAQVAHTHILIILKKIRLNDAYYRLAIDFGLSIGSVSKIVNKHLLKLASYFKSLIFWPDADKIKLNLPISFRYRYNKVQSIIDCLEIEIQQPSNALHQALTWSNYKKANTIKYLISSTPDGIINFISEGFGGRITDKEIIEASGFLNVLPPCDVMADRGFKAIAGLLKQKNCNLVRPPSVQSGMKSTKEEVKESKRIASLRIHIERVIRRLREFVILDKHACLNHELVSKIDYFIIIACGIVNLQGPLIIH